MNAGHTSERVQDALRRLIMERRFRPGARLEPGELAAMLNASTTPVREALNHLAGAGLVESRSGGGFHLPLVDEAGLQDLYMLSGETLHLALHAPRLARLAETDASTASGQSADQVASLFQHIASASSNREHGLLMKRVNDRLHAARLGEEEILAGWAEEWTLLLEHVRRSDLAQLRRALARYHQRRVKVAGLLLRLIYWE